MHKKTKGAIAEMRVASKLSVSEKPWSVYIIKCRDGKLYTGISNDVPKRVNKHNAGKGCRFTKCRFPVRLVYTEECGTRSTALKMEMKIKSFPRNRKLKLATQAYRLLQTATDSL